MAASPCSLRRWRWVVSNCLCTRLVTCSWHLAGEKSASRAAGIREERALVVTHLAKEGAEPVRTGMQVTETRSPSTRRELREQARLIELGAHVTPAPEGGKR